MKELVIIVEGLVENSPDPERLFRQHLGEALPVLPPGLSLLLLVLPLVLIPLLELVLLGELLLTVVVVVHEIRDCFLDGIRVVLEPVGLDVVKFLTLLLKLLLTVLGMIFLSEEVFLLLRLVLLLLILFLLLLIDHLGILQLFLKDDLFLDLGQGGLDGVDELIELLDRLDLEGLLDDFDLLVGLDPLWLGVPLSLVLFVFLFLDDELALGDEEVEDLCELALVIDLELGGGIALTTGVGSTLDGGVLRGVEVGLLVNLRSIELLLLLEVGVPLPP